MMLHVLANARIIAVICLLVDMVDGLFFLFFRVDDMVL